MGQTKIIEARIDSPRESFEYVTGSPQTVLTAGWALFRDEPAAFIKIILDGDILVIEKFNTYRPRLLSKYPEAKNFNMPVAFDYEIKLPSDMASCGHELRFVAITISGHEVPIGHVWFEAIPSSPEMTFPQRFATIPVPLLVKINAGVSEEIYSQKGRDIADIICEQVDNSDRAEKALDFGCGLGRVLLPMMSRLKRTEFTGFDIDPLSHTLADYLLGDNSCRFVTTTLDLSDNMYDLIYAVSVFTHIDNSRDYWLAEIHRILAPQGRAFISYNDETLFHEEAGTVALPGVEKNTEMNGYYVTGKDTPEGGASKGVFYTTEHWSSAIGKYFNIEKTVPRGILGRQSFSIVTKKNIAVDRTPADKNYIREIEKELFSLRKKYEERF